MINQSEELFLAFRSYVKNHPELYDKLFRSYLMRGNYCTSYYGYSKVKSAHRIQVIWQLEYGCQDTQILLIPTLMIDNPELYTQKREQYLLYLKIQTQREQAKRYFNRSQELINKYHTIEKNLLANSAKYFEKYGNDIPIRYIQNTELKG